MEGATEAAHWLRAMAAEAGLSDRLAFALEVCLEELSTNVARHGRNPDSADVEPLVLSVRLTLGTDAVELTIDDNGRHFDVSQSPGRPIRKPLEEVILGGLGMQLIRSFSSELSYERLADGNRVILKFPRVAAAHA
jgi:anti-sigma regulatory factor (Ser/Thr protein kinase)